MSSFIQVPCGRAGHALLHHRHPSWGEQLVLVGGYNELGPLADIWIYDIQKSLWSEIMGGVSNKGPLPRVGFSACLLGSKVYLFGGMEQDNQQALIYNDLWSFDLISRQWIMLIEEAPVSERMGHISVAVGTDALIVHGGECLGNVFSDTWLYSATTDTWQIINKNALPNQTNIPPARSSHSACFQRESKSVVLFGGMVPTKVSSAELSHMNDMWVLDVSAGVADVKSWAWRRVEAAATTTTTTTKAAAAAASMGMDMEVVSEADISDAKYSTDTHAVAENDDQGDSSDDDDSDIFPSPRELPAVLPTVLVDGMPGLLVFGGFGLREVSEEGEVSDSSKSDQMATEQSEVPGEVVEITYLGDMWAIDLNGGCSEINDSNVRIENLSAPASTLNVSAQCSWSSGGAKRGCQLVNTSQGVFSFGGFNGAVFCSDLELLQITV